MGKDLMSMTEVIPLGRVCVKACAPPRGRRDSRRYRIKGKVKVCYFSSGTSNQNLGSVTPKLWIGDRSSRTLEINGTRSCTGIGMILDAYDDPYGGVVINSGRLPWDVKDFGVLLQASLQHWSLKAKKGVWLKLPIDRAELVPIAIKEGFKYHHAEPDYVMLTYWIPDGPSLLPSNASHQVGVGGFVINDKNEVLVVQEKYCTVASTDVWKIPTGFINESEEIFDGVVREVKEETDVETEFLEVIAFRHVHCAAFKKSDLFFVCMLRPLSSHIKIDEKEIQAAKWMPLGEFVEQPFIHEDDMFRKVTDICIARRNDLYCGLEVHRMISKFDGKYSSLYYNVSEQESCQADGQHTS